MIKLCLVILKQFLCPGQCVRQATDIERKLQSSHYGDERKVKVCGQFAIYQTTTNRYGEPCTSWLKSYR